MNTPAHVILNATALGRGRWREMWMPITVGSLLPDLPMLGFYLFQRLIGVPERVIWSDRYFDTTWQQLFDVFNSIPLILIGAALARWRGAERWLALFASMGLHAVADLLVHREDAHGHFFPLTDWRFMSPLSYWEPDHYGSFFLAFELALILVGGVALARRPQRGWRGVGRATLALSLAFGVFAVATWGVL